MFCYIISFYFSPTTLLKTLPCRMARADPSPSPSIQQNMFDNLITRITSPSSRRRHTYHCPEVHSDPEDAEPITPRKPRLLERRKKGRRLIESGLRQARSLGRLDGLKEVSGILILIYLIYKMLG